MGTTSTPNKGLVMPDDIGEAAPNWTDQWQANAAKLDKTINKITRNVYTANDTWTKPAGLMYAEVEVQGGGGAGGGAAATAASQYALGAGGCAGGYTRKLFAAADLGATESVVVGAGGTGVSGAAGNNGASSTFDVLTGAGGAGGSICTANGTGQNTVTPTPTAGGAGSGGDVNVTGGVGSAGLGLTQGQASGNGGDSYFAGGGTGQRVQASAHAATGAAGTLGAGGGGSSNRESQTARVGGAGGTGVVIVTNYISDAG